MRIIFDHYAQRAAYIDAVIKVGECGIMGVLYYKITRDVTEGNN